MAQAQGNSFKALTLDILLLVERRLMWRKRRQTLIRDVQECAAKGSDDAK